VIATFSVTGASAALDTSGHSGSDAPGQAPTPYAATAIDFTSLLVRTVDTAAFAKPSPDPAGLAYLAGSNTLLLTDADVDEDVDGITHFQGANVWELTLGGTVVRTTNISTVEPTVFPMSEEPSGVAVNPFSGECFVSDDSQRQVYRMNPATDGACGTPTTARRSFRRAPSGRRSKIAYDSWRPLSPSAHQIYDVRVPVGQFDVLAHGVDPGPRVQLGSGALRPQQRPERSDRDRDHHSRALPTIDVSAAGANKPTGLVYAPASDGSGAKRFYILDRGVATASNPNLVDGKLYELTAPQLGTPQNAAPAVNAGADLAVTLPATASLDATVSDDGVPGPVTSLWTQQGGPSTVTFGDASAVDDRQRADRRHVPPSPDGECGVRSTFDGWCSPRLAPAAWTSSTSRSTPARTCGETIQQHPPATRIWTAHRRRRTTSRRLRFNGIGVPGGHHHERVRAVRG
jgi:hypothetical protein